MKITGGEFRGLIIALPRLANLKPTSERVREAIFSTLGSFFPLSGKTVLDLFSGSGALGLEALSRNAKKVIFVEKNKLLTVSIQENLEKLKVSHQAEVFCREVDLFLQTHSAKLLAKNSISSLPARTQPELDKEAAFDIIFADPPYALWQLNPIQGEKEIIHLPVFLRWILEYTWVKEGSLLILEIPSKALLPDRILFEDHPLSASLVKDKRYGDTRVKFYLFEEKKIQRG